MKTAKRAWIPALILICATMASAQIPDFRPPNPLFAAALRNDTVAVRHLLESGSNPNDGNFVGFRPVFLAVMHHNTEMLQNMVAHGADVHATDGGGSTTLMWAAADEQARTDMIEELLRLGVNPRSTNQYGESALTWALRRGETPIVKILRERGLGTDELMQKSVERAVALLQRSGQEFTKVSGCASCHNQSLPQMTVALARSRGFAVDEEISRQQVDAVSGLYKGLRPLMEEDSERLPDPPIAFSYALLGLAAEGYRGDEVTATMANVISAHQMPDGHFRVFPGRPPMEVSSITGTALSLRALQLFGRDADERIRLAAKWLSVAPARSTEERTMKMLGLHWADPGSRAIGEIASQLLSEQRPEGGWAQLASLETDAYATGQVLTALMWTGQLKATDEAYRRGVGYLLRTQLADGSWLVRSRVYPLQPYKESGFPHGKDQWISAAGTSWAAMALTLGRPPVNAKSN